MAAVHGDRRVHHAADGLEPDAAATAVAGSVEGGRDERVGEAPPAGERPDVHPLQLGAAVLVTPDRHDAGGHVAVEGDEQGRLFAGVVTGEIVELGGERRLLGERVEVGGGAHPADVVVQQGGGLLPVERRGDLADDLPGRYRCITHVHRE